MPKVRTQCLSCGIDLWRSPSKIEPRNYCSRECYSETRNKELLEKGKPFRIDAKKSKKLSAVRLKGLKKIKAEKHYAWKGERVGYRGLHYWIRRNLGKPTKCLHCGKEDDRPRFIQWANLNREYRRVLSDYITLCASCHKKYDLNYNH